MKHSLKTTFILFGMIGLGIMQSCSDDNDNPNPSPTGANTLTFSRIDHVELKMWTDGAEVNTDGLSIENYMDSDFYNSISAEHYSSQAGLTFENDSLFSEVDGMILGYPYHISNDSIYVTTTYNIGGSDPIVSDLFIGIGNTTSLYIPHMYYKIVINSGMGSVETSSLTIGHYTFDQVTDETGAFEWVADIQENDTLIIYNQRAQYN